MDQISGDLQIKEALKKFYGQYMLGDEAVAKSVNYADFGILKIPFPNLKKRREIVYLHDINHLLSGYDTSWVGEGEVAAWELASGFPKHCWVGYLYAPFTFLVGFALNPNRVFEALKRGRTQKNSCYSGLSKDALLDLTLDQLKFELGHA